MSRFKFGELEALVNRIGPAAGMPGMEEYRVRISGPEDDSWIESIVRTKEAPRTSAVYFDLAWGVLGGLNEAARDPKLWRVKMRNLYPQISDEEFEATLQMAQKLSPYLGPAMEDAISRIGLYHEGREAGRPPALGIAMPLHLPSKIRTKKDIATFFAYLYVEEKLNFHPDGDFNSYVDRGTGAPSYTMDEAHDRNRLMAEAFDVAAKEKLNIHEIALWVGSLLEVVGSDTDVSDVPVWLRELSETWM